MERVNYRRVPGPRRVQLWAAMFLMGGAMMWLPAFANGQQATTPDQVPPQNAQQGQDAAQPQHTQPANQFDQQQIDQPGTYQEQGGTERSATQQDRSMMRDTQRQPAEQGAMSAGRPGELGVFLVQGSGPGVAIAQIVGGSAAEAAGLEPGDVILQVNSQGVGEPREITRMIRAIPAGEMVTLHIWRDGQEQDIQATLQPSRRTNRVGYRGSDAMGMNGDLASRTQRLEEQLSMVLRELQQLRQEVMQLRAARPGTSTGQPGLQSQLDQGTQQGLDTTQQNATQPGLDKAPGQPATPDTDTGLPF